MPEVGATTAASWDEQAQCHKVTWTFTTMTTDLVRLAEWLAEQSVTHVAMESTSGFLAPIFNLLEGQFVVVLANAARVKAVPGRKTDVRDSEWLLELFDPRQLHPVAPRQGSPRIDAVPHQPDPGG